MPKNRMICGTCYWHKREGDEWVCVNKNSDYCADYTEYDDTCEEWEERE